VWNVDFTGTYTPGVYRLAVEGVGASQDFTIDESTVYEPYRVSTLGFFYMRIGQDNLNMTPVPRRPLFIPGQDPAECKVIVTDMDPYHANWSGGGDRWDQPGFFAGYTKSGNPENPNAIGGHSDALDWDRHLGHVSIIYDMLLPYILTNGGNDTDSDGMGITESGNGIPDIIDEARNEVDFWLNLRYQGGYSHGLSNPNGSSILYQADNTAVAAWANAVNAAMLAEAFRIAGTNDLMMQYLTSAEEAWDYANGLSDQMLDAGQNVGESTLTGRDFKITAAAWLYNLTGDAAYEDVIAAESLITSGTSQFIANGRNQLYAIAAYLTTTQPVNYPQLRSNMYDSVIYQARRQGVNRSNARPSRRSTDHYTGWFHTTQNVHRVILAHAVTTDVTERAQFERALVLEADWGLGRNGANTIQMTTASTPLASKRSVMQAYTSGWNDGTPGVHPGHTPFMNMGDWSGTYIMSRPSWLAAEDRLHPSMSSWPRGELFFDVRYIYAHSEFPPQQSMRGKHALYGYLAGITR
jgi:hypothetical protein